MSDLDLELSALVHAAAFLCTLYAFWRLYLRPSLQSKEPVEGLPTPPHCHFLFGHLWIFRNRAFEDLMQHLSYKYANDQGRASMFQGPFKTVMLTKPEDVRAALMNETQHKVVPMFQRHLTKFLGRKNIGLLSGRLWKHERSSILKALTPKSLELSQEAMVKVTSTMVNTLKQRIGSGAVTLDAEHLMKMITLDVFGLAAFSHSFGCCKMLELSSVAGAFDFLASDLFRRLNKGPFLPGNFFYWLPNKFNKRHREETAILRSFVTSAIESRRGKAGSKPGRPDLVSCLVEAHEMAKDTPIEHECTEEVLRDVIVSLLFAGFDTTSVALCYALYTVAVNPDIHSKCIEEIERVGVNDPENLVYVRSTIKEVLRMYPPAFVTSRFLQKPVRLSDGFVIPADIKVLVPIWAIQRSELNFPDALSCRPDRWAQWNERDGGKWEERDSNPKDPKAIPRGNDAAFLVFSAGARSCPGQKFAWKEAVVVFAGLISELNFSPVPGYKLEPDRKGIVQHPKGGIPMNISLRNRSEDENGH